MERRRTGTQTFVEVGSQSDQCRNQNVCEFLLKVGDDFDIRKINN